MNLSASLLVATSNAMNRYIDHKSAGRSLQAQQVLEHIDRLFMLSGEAHLATFGW